MLKVYVVGLIYFNGCDEDVKRMWAPDGRAFDPPHNASLFIAADLIDEGETEWWDGSRISHDDIGVVEFRIPNPADIQFPDGESVPSCVDLDDKLSKLKKKKGDVEYPFDVDPDTALTIAEVTIDGGSIAPARYGDIGLVEWTMDNDVLAIAATLEDGTDSKTITLNAPPVGDAEVVLANTHDLFAVGAAGKEEQAGDHVALFINLSPDPDATIVSIKATGSVGQVKTDNAILKLMKTNAHTEGNTPTCCVG